MKRLSLIFLQSAAACLMLVFASAVFAAEPARPNILWVIADDFGVDASPCYKVAGEKPRMPTLETLCKQGVVFDNAWAYPTCSPMRASVLTGQFGFRTNVLAPGDALATNTETILQVMSRPPANYANAVIGKWHLGGMRADPQQPTKMGAQYFSGFMSGAVRDYYSWPLVEMGQTRTENVYTTTAMTNSAIKWMAAQKDPWFLWLAYNAPHTPFHVPPAELISKESLAAAQGSSNRAKYFAAAEAMDTELGRLLASMSAAQRKNTVVFFMGDNGTPGQVVQAPFSRTHAKGSIYQGGVHAPLVVAGAGVTRHGERESALITSTDLFATFASLGQTGQAAMPDSHNFAPMLSAQNVAGRSYAYVDYRSDTKGNEPSRSGSAVRDARYKLIEYSDGVNELYDLQADPYEARNLLSSARTAEITSIVDRLVSSRKQMQNRTGAN